MLFQGTSTTQEEMGLPTWTPSDVSTFFIKNEGETSKKGKSEEKEDCHPTHQKTYSQRMEVPGLALVSVLGIMARATGGIWESTARHLPKEIKALVI